MGYEIASFNMREEVEKGKFPADESCVRTFDPRAVHNWRARARNDEAGRVHKLREMQLLYEHPLDQQLQT